MNFFEKYAKAIAIAVALPSTILGIFFGVYVLIQKNIISEVTALILILLVVINSLYMLLRYGSKK